MNNMRVSDRGAAAIVAHEGIVTSRYLDSVGVWTIGVGHTAAAGGIDPAKYFDTVSVRKALAIFRVDLAKYEADVNKAVKVPLQQHQFDALVSFHYNTGAIFKAELTRSLNMGFYERAGKQFLNWMRPKEIEGRRRAESRLFLTGEYPDTQANVYPTDKSGRVLWSKGIRLPPKALLEDEPEGAVLGVKAPVPEPVINPFPPEPRPVSKPPSTIKAGLQLIGALASYIFTSKGKKS